MSDKPDKPDDPEATVSFVPRKPAPEEDATVAMTSRDLLKAPDEKAPDDDATVRISAHDLLKEPEPEPEPIDDDATVTNLTREALMAPPAEPAPAAKPQVDDDATVSIPPGGLKIAAEAAAAAATAAAATAAAAAQPARPAAAAATGGIIGSSPASLAAEPSRMPMIAGGIVVVVVALYLMFGGDAKSPTETPKAPPSQAAAPAAPPTPASSAAPAAPAAPAASAPSAPAAASPAAPAAPAAAPAAAPVAGKPSVKDLLAADVKRGTVAVQDEGGVTTITIPMSHQFASGGTDPEAKLRPVLLSIAAALDKASGAIVVIGHADSSPSSNPKFPTNQELSAARGAAAAKLMASKLRDPKRISSEGASDSKPLVPSDSAENRARNRRVVIVLKPAA